MMLKSKIQAWKYVLLIAVGVMSIVATTLYFIVVENNGYDPFPKNSNRKEELIRYLNPDKRYVYWGYYEGNFGFNSKKNNIRYNRGAMPKTLEIEDPGGSLFMGCMPSSCYKYIAYVDNGKIKYITSNNALIKFIGQIDNLQEAMLVAYAKGYYVDSSFGMGYRKIAGGYELIVKRETMCPRIVETYLLKFGKTGIYEIKRKNVDNIGGCIMF